MRRRDVWILRAFALWTCWVWLTRIGNVLGDDERGFAFKAVHVALALVSVAFAVVTWRIAARSRGLQNPPSR